MQREIMVTIMYLYVFVFRDFENTNFANVSLSNDECVNFGPGNDLKLILIKINNL